MSNLFISFYFANSNDYYSLYCYYCCFFLVPCQIFEVLRTDKYHVFDIVFLKTTRAIYRSSHPEKQRKRFFIFPRLLINFARHTHVFLQSVKMISGHKRIIYIRFSPLEIRDSCILGSFSNFSLLCTLICFLFFAIPHKINSPSSLSILKVLILYIRKSIIYNLRRTNTNKKKSLCRKKLWDVSFFLPGRRSTCNKSRHCSAGEKKRDFFLRVKS